MIPLRVKYIPAGEEIPAVKEEGMLYFVESQNTIYKDGIVPFGGINNVTFTKDGNVTKITFSTDGSDSGNAGTIIVSNGDLADYVESIKSKVDDLDERVTTLEYSTSNVYNLDLIAPSSSIRNLPDAVDYISHIGIVNPVNTGIIFNDGDSSQIYYYNGNTTSGLSDETNWSKVTTEEKILHFNTKSDFPAVGTAHTLYIDTSSNEMWYWDDNNIMYKQCGFDPLNIKFIDSNF